MTKPLTYAGHPIDPDLQRLIEAHPRLFRGRVPRVWSDVSPGWYDILDKLCTDIETELGPVGCDDFEIDQIKEKFGTLCFYYQLGGRMDVHIDVTSAEDRAHLAIPPVKSSVDVEAMERRLRGLVAMACEASKTACRKCGRVAEMRNIGGWLTVLCEEHLAERLAKVGE